MAHSTPVFGAATGELRFGDQLSAISSQPSPRGEREHLWRLGETVAELKADG
jgi:hypothetical protein